MRNPRLFESSLKTIRSLQEEGGGITATPKDDVYPYVYPRDAVFMTVALNSCGDVERSKDFYRFLLSVRRPFGEFHQRYNDGLPYVTNEHELDTTPIVLHGIYDTFAASGDRMFMESMWSLVQECASFTITCIDPQMGLIHTTNSIHETRQIEEGFDVWANAAAARGLLDASGIARAMGRPELEEAWADRAGSLIKSVWKGLYDPEHGMFAKVRRRSGDLVHVPDMSQLAPFYFGVCDDDQLLTRTLEHLKDSLWNKEIGGFNRFRDFEVVDDWHWYTGGTDASWPFFTLWAARFYRKLGMREYEEQCLDFLDSVVTSDLLIAEKVAPIQGYERWKSNELEFSDRVINGMRKIERNVHRISVPNYVCWGCPLGWAHAEYILFEKGVGFAATESLQRIFDSIPRINQAATTTFSSS